MNMKTNGKCKMHIMYMCSEKYYEKAGITIF